MTISTEVGILEAVKASIESLRPANPAVRATDVLIYPDDYARKKLSLPFVVVRMAFGPHQNTPHGLSSVLREASLQIEVYTAKGTMPVPSIEHAASELKKRQWGKVIAEWLIDDRTLTGTVDVIGNEDIFFTDERVYLQWNQDEYDGLYITVPFVYQEC